MKNKDWKRHIAYEALVILGMLALLTYICRLWPILLLIILGIFAAVIRLLFLSSKTVQVIEPLPLLPEPVRKPTENDVETLAYAVILRRITELIAEEYPKARWIWQVPNARQLLMQGETAFILLNHAGGFRQAKVIIKNLQVVGIEFVSKDKNVTEFENNPVLEIEPDLQNETEEQAENEAPIEENEENYELLAFEWVDSHIFELNERCNEAIGQSLSELILLDSELPVKESWQAVCRELSRTGLENVQCVPDGIKINFMQ